MEEKLRSFITKHEVSYKKVDFFSKYMSNMTSENDIIDKITILENNVNKAMDFSLNTKKTLIDQKTEHNAALEESITNSDNGLKEDFKAYEELNKKLKEDKIQFNNDRNQKLSTFNLINKKRREINKKHEEDLIKYSNNDNEVKKIYLDFLLLLRLLKCRIVNFYEIIKENTTNIVGYLLNLETMDFKLLKSNSKDSNYDKCFNFWKGMKEIYIDYTEKRDKINDLDIKEIIN